MSETVENRSASDRMGLVTFEHRHSSSLILQSRARRKTRGKILKFLHASAEDTPVGHRPRVISAAAVASLRPGTGTARKSKPLRRGERCVASRCHNLEEYKPLSVNPLYLGVELHELVGSSIVKNIVRGSLFQLGQQHRATVQLRH